jgi:hypothetical protein
MSQCGMIADEAGKCIFSWRYMEDDVSPLSVPIVSGQTVLFLPDEMDQEAAYDIHRTLDQWSLSEVEGILGGRRVPIELPAPAENQQHWLVTGVRVIVENGRPHRKILPPGRHAPEQAERAKEKQDLLDRLAGRASRQMLVEEDGTPTEIRGVSSKDRVVLILPGSPLLTTPVPPSEETP